MVERDCRPFLNTECVLIFPDRFEFSAELKIKVMWSITPGEIK